MFLGAILIEVDLTTTQQEAIFNSVTNIPLTTHPYQMEELGPT